MNIKKDEILLDRSFPFQLTDEKMAPFYDMGRTLHWHECLEISYVKSGWGKYHIEGKTFDMAAGDIIIINNLEPHYLEVGSEGMHQPVMVFDPALVWSQSNCSMDYEYLSPFFERGSDFCNKLDLSNPVIPEIMEHIRAIENEYVEKPQAHNLMIKAHLLMILTYLIRYFRDRSKASLAAVQKRQQLMKIEESINLINSCFNSEIRLEDLAAKAYMSPQYFSSYFKKVMGVNFVDYLNQVRINNAIRLLKETDMKITNIAMESGFNSAATFNSAFKKYTGKTPSKYR